MDDFIPSENLKRFHRPSDAEQLNRSAVDQFVASKTSHLIRRQLENGADEFTRSTVLQLLLHEAEKSCLTRQQLDRIDRHMAELRQPIYRQVELVEKDKLKGHNAERVQNLLATLNDLMTNYQILRRRISASG